MQECSCLLSAFIFIILLARYRVVCYTLARRHPYFIRIESLFPGMKTDFRRKRVIKGTAIIDQTAVRSLTQQTQGSPLGQDDR